MNVTPFQGNLKGRLTSSWLGFGDSDSRSEAHLRSAYGHMQKWMQDASAFTKQLMEKVRAVSEAPFLRSIISSRRATSPIRVMWAGVLRPDSNHYVAEANEEMRFQVANQMYLQGEGQRLVFDDTWNPEAWQGMSGYRIVFQSDAVGSEK